MNIFSLENLYSEIVDDLKANKNYDLNLKQIFSESINSHLMSDVPVSLFLSSGFDSSIIASLANQKISSITIGFEKFERDYEIDNAKKISDFFNIKHIAKVFSKNDVLSKFHDYISKVDIPSNDGFNVFLVSNVANQSKV